MIKYYCQFFLIFSFLVSYAKPILAQEFYFTTNPTAITMTFPLNWTKEVSKKQNLDSIVRFRKNYPNNNKSNPIIAVGKKLIDPTNSIESAWDFKPTANEKSKQFNKIDTNSVIANLPQKI